MSEPETPDCKCDLCDAVFQVIWQRSLLIDGVVYCPFCGEDWQPSEVNDE